MSRRPAAITTASTAAEVVLVEDPSPSGALAAWRRGLAGSDVVAVLDASWPAQLRASALAVIEEAAASGAYKPRDLVLFTSGSSGRARAVHRSRRSWERSAAPFSEAIGLSAAAGHVVAIPGHMRSTLFSFGAWHALAEGCEVVAAPIRELAGHPLAETISHIHVVPAMLPSLFAEVGDGGLPRLRTVVVAGDVLPPTARAQAEALGIRLVEYYGAAELSLVAVRDVAGPLRPFPGVEVQVRDGLLWSRSPYQSYGYLGESGPLLREAGGWASVGDLAIFEPGGFTVRGRGDAAVSTGGHTVVVEEVERFLRALPGVVDAGVVGVPFPRLGRRVVAVVQGDCTVEGLRDQCRLLPDWSRPRAFIAATVPRARTGKILREALLEVAVAELSARHDASHRRQERAS